MNIIGIDIGGTKCAVLIGRVDQDGTPSIAARTPIQTKDFPAPVNMLNHIQEQIQNLLTETKIEMTSVASVGITCGGPLDSKRGVILSPPNLPGWDNIRVVQFFAEKYSIPVALQNDANACALAEWKFGAGRGLQNMIFLTFGTGMGAGLILNGSLYTGTNDNAGEVGHIRLADFGPVGYGKSGSFEGFCSGGGIAQLAKTKVMEKLQMGKTVKFCKSVGEINSVTARTVALAAEAGDDLALDIYHTSGIYLGKGLSVLIDILNPEAIVIGSIFERSGGLLINSMQETINMEALPLACKVCRILPSMLGDSLGDFAALSVGLNAVRDPN